jgi:hypothetical protein
VVPTQPEQWHVLRGIVLEDEEMLAFIEKNR